MLILLLVLLVVSLAGLGLLQRRRPLGRPGLITYLGLDVALLGELLSPGIGWGDTDDRSLRNPASTLIFFVGFGMMIWGAVLRRRAHRS